MTQLSEPSRKDKEYNVPEEWDFYFIVRPWSNMKNYIEGQAKNLEKDSSEDNHKSTSRWHAKVGIWT
jgi:hypothetical protein